MKKSYNLFTMWGTYAGAFILYFLIGTIIAFFFFYDINLLREFNFPIFQGICGGYGFLSGLGCVLFFGLLTVLIIFLIGGVLGGIVHSLYRRFTK